MGEAEKLEVLRKLRAGRDALGEALAGVDDATAARKTSDGWSILDCVEHVAVGDIPAVAIGGIATLEDHPFEKWRREAKIAGLAADRGGGSKLRSRHIRTAGITSLDEAVAAFEALPAQTWCDGWRIATTIFAA